MKGEAIFGMNKNTKTKKAGKIINANFGLILKEELIKKASEETGIGYKSVKVLYEQMERMLIRKLAEKNRLKREGGFRKNEVTTYKGRKRRKFYIDDSKLSSFGSK